MTLCVAWIREKVSPPELIFATDIAEPAARAQCSEALALGGRKTLITYERILVQMNLEAMRHAKSAVVGPSRDQVGTKPGPSYPVRTHHDAQQYQGRRHQVGTKSKNEEKDHE